jgi:hypothetical protein
MPIRDDSNAGSVTANGLNSHAGQGLALAAGVFYLLLVVAGLSDIVFIVAMVAAVLLPFLVPVLMIGRLGFLLLRRRHAAETRKWLGATLGGLAGLAAAVFLNSCLWILFWRATAESEDNLGGESALVLLLALPLLPALFVAGAYIGWTLVSGDGRTTSPDSNRS